MNSLLENIDEHWADINGALFLDINKVVGNVHKGRHKILLIAEKWERFEESKVHKAKNSYCHWKGAEQGMQGVKRSVRYDRMDFTIVVVKEAESAANNYVLAIYLMTKVLAGCRQYLVGPAWDDAA